MKAILKFSCGLFLIMNVFSCKQENQFKCNECNEDGIAIFEDKEFNFAVELANFDKYKGKLTVKFGIIVNKNKLKSIDKGYRIDSFNLILLNEMDKPFQLKSIDGYPASFIDTVGKVNIQVANNDQIHYLSSTVMPPLKFDSSAYIIDNVLRYLI